MIACPSCTSARPDCWLQESTDRRGQLQCPQCWRYFVFVAAELLAAGIADPIWHDDPQRREADLRELEQLRAAEREGGLPKTHRP